MLIWSLVGCWIQRHSQRLLDSRSLSPFPTRNECDSVLRQHHGWQPRRIDRVLVCKGSLELADWDVAFPHHRRQCRAQQPNSGRYDSRKLGTAQQRSIRSLPSRVSLSHYPMSRKLIRTAGSDHTIRSWRRLYRWRFWVRHSTVLELPRPTMPALLASTTLDSYSVLLPTSSYVDPLVLLPDMNCLLFPRCDPLVLQRSILTFL